MVLALLLAGTGVWLTPALRAPLARLAQPAVRTIRAPEPSAPVLATQTAEAQPTVPLLLELPRAALTASQAAELVQALQTLLGRVQLQLGLLLPRVAIHLIELDDTETDPGPGGPAAGGWRLMAFEVPIAQGELPVEALPQALAQACWQALRRHATLFLGTQETGALLTRAGIDYPDVVKEVLRALPLARVAEILRRLVEEEVPIRNQRDILEALADAAQREKDVYALTELARIALKRQTSHRVAPGGTLRALLLTPEFEEQLRAAIRVSNGQQSLALDPQQAQAAMQRLAHAVQACHPAAIVTAVDIRRHVRKLIELECFDTPVLSYHELMPTLQLQVLQRVGPEDTVQLEAA
jgi:type III secretion protein V